MQIDGKPVDYFSRIPELIGDRAGSPVTIMYDRDGKRGEAVVTPIADKAVDCAGKQLNQCFEQLLLFEVEELAFDRGRCGAG